MSALRRFWCRHFHGLPMLPVHGRYTCRKCLETFSVAWEAPPLGIRPLRAVEAPAAPETGIEKERRALAELERMGKL